MGLVTPHSICAGLEKKRQGGEKGILGIITVLKKEREKANWPKGVRLWGFLLGLNT